MSTKLKSVRAPGEAKRQELLQKSEQILSQVSIPELPLSTLCAFLCHYVETGAALLGSTCCKLQKIKKFNSFSRISSYYFTFFS